MITTVINRIVHSAASTASNSKEQFHLKDAATKVADKQQNNYNGAALIAAIVTLVVVFIILVFIGQYLWNNFIAGAKGGPGLITIAQKAENVWQIIGLWLFVMLLTTAA